MNVDPAIRPAMQNPARIFLSSSTSMMGLLPLVDDAYKITWGENLVIGTRTYDAASDREIFNR